MRDPFSDIAALAQVDLAESPDAYGEAMKHAYREDKDLSGAMAIAWAGISRLLALAHAASRDRAHELRSRAQALTYDLASFTWPGWDEPGIVITPAERRAGLGAARANLTFAVDLDKGALPLARAHWMYGAHELAAKRFDEARRSFETAATDAGRAGTEGASQVALSTAFARLAALADGSGSEADLTAALADLADAEDGQAYRQQLLTARSVLEL